MGDAKEKEPIARYLESLQSEKIPFMLIGMSAAVVQGVAGQTLDVDLWVGLPARQYMRPMNLAVEQGGVLAAKTVVYLSDGTPVNFVYEVTGLSSFRTERKRAILVPFYGLQVPTLPLERIRKSKAAIGRDKDLLHLKLIDEFLACRKSAANPRDQAGGSDES